MDDSESILPFKWVNFFLKHHIFFKCLVSYGGIHFCFHLFFCFSTIQITTVGRYSGGTTRSRIPLGSFFGHTYILPWEMPSHSASNPSVLKAPNSQCKSTKTSVPTENGEGVREEAVKNNSEGDDPCEMTAHASLLSQLSLFLSLLEDLQCRFNLARTRLESLLTVVGNAQFLSSHVQYHLKRNTSGKLSEEDAQIIQVRLHSWFKLIYI